MDMTTGTDLPMPGKPTDISGPIYLAVAGLSVVTIVVGAILGYTLPALAAGLLIPIGGVVLSLVAMVTSIGPALKSHNGQFANFTSFSPEEEKAFVVFEKTSHETQKKASTIAIISVGSVGLLFTIIVFIFAPKGEHGGAHAPTPAAAEKK